MFWTKNILKVYIIKIQKFWTLAAPTLFMPGNSPTPPLKPLLRRLWRTKSEKNS